MKYNITAGNDKAEAELAIDDKGRFVGTMKFPGYDSAVIGGTARDNQLRGNIDMDGHHATFEATISGAQISGKLTVPWPLNMVFPSRAFTGSEMS